MVRHREKLTAEFVRTVTEAGKYSDEHGLVLRVMPSGSKQWVQRLTVRGKRRDLGLGGYPLVTLSDARKAALGNRKVARAGADPLEKKRRRAPTFEEAAATVFEIKRPHWKNAKHITEWMASLRRYVFPRFGKIRIDLVSTTDVLDVLLPIWDNKHETTRRIRERISTVMRWAVAERYRMDNPAGDTIATSLPQYESVQRAHKALPYSRVASAVEVVRMSGAAVAVKLAFEFLVLTACRPSDVRLARWDEFNLEDGEWTIPPDRLRPNREHRAPLSARARELLLEAREIADGSGVVFPSSRGQPLSDQMMSKLLRKLEIQAVPHGFRSSFRQWAEECTTVASAVVETALARTVRTTGSVAHTMSDLFERHHELMNSWASYLAQGAECD